MLGEAVGLPEAPGEDDGEGDLVELEAAPVGGAVDPEILGKAAVGLLRAGEIDEGAARGLTAAAGQQCGCGLHHVARPHQVIAAEIVVALGLAPGDGGRSDEGAGEGLVLVGEENVVAGAHQLAAVAGVGCEPLGIGDAMPLLDEALAMFLEGHGQRDS